MDLQGMHEVTVQRSNGAFGFSVAGGAEHSAFPCVTLMPGQQVKCEGDGELRNGDEIIKVNQEVVLGLAHRDVVQHIVDSGDKVALTVVPPCGAVPRSLADLLQTKNADSETQAIVSSARRHIYELATPVTTRPRRADETDGVDYTFVSEERFLQMRDSNAFLEFGQVGAIWYGTPKVTADDIEQQRPQRRRDSLKV